MEESRDSEREAGTQKHEGTEMRGPRETIRACPNVERHRETETMGDSCRMDAKYSVQASPAGTTKVRWGCLAYLLLSWPQALTLAPELSLSHGLQQQCSYWDRALGETFRPPQTGPSATIGSQTRESLPGQARSQAQLGVATPAASIKQLPAPLIWPLGQSYHQNLPTQ